MLRIFSIFALCFSLLPLAHANAGTADDALVFLRARHKRVNSVLRKPETPRRAKQLSNVLGDFLDYDSIAKYSLDKEWNVRSHKDRSKFTSLLRQLVERQYQNNMERTLNYRVKYIKGEGLEDGALVRTKARSIRKKRSPEIEVAYSMRPEGKNWRVYDIETDGVSLIKNYRRQFRRILQKEGWNGLIGRMEKKLNKESAF